MNSATNFNFISIAVMVFGLITQTEKSFWNKINLVSIFQKLQIIAYDM
jgi:hypothetical protein